MHQSRPLALALFSLALLSGCASTPRLSPLPAPQEAFWDALQSHCGKAYAGALASDDARDAAMRGRAMIAHWARCQPDRIAVAFHIADPEAPGGWNRSRTWVVTRHADGLRLKHHHYHADGSADAVTLYGGDTLSSGTAPVQDFPVDAFSQALFGREGLDASLTNVWRIEVDAAGTPGARFAYQLTRRNDATRLFRVAFDLTERADPPPEAWGW